MKKIDNMGESEREKEGDKEELRSAKEIKSVENKSEAKSANGGARRMSKIRERNERKGMYRDVEE